VSEQTRSTDAERQRRRRAALKASRIPTSDQAGAAVVAALRKLVRNPESPSAVRLVQEAAAHLEKLGHDRGKAFQAVRSRLFPDSEPPPVPDSATERPATLSRKVDLAGIPGWDDRKAEFERQRGRRSQGCWEWQGDLTTGGYGLFTVRGFRFTAHRLAAAQAYGPLEAGTVVLHRCDNRKCTRPDHLRVGTQRLNVQDMAVKGRAGPESLKNLGKRILKSLTGED
jgi:hypothetical protein